MSYINIISIENFIILSAIIFVIGLSGIFINRKSIISILISIELLILSININFVAFSVYLNDMVGQIFTLFTIAVAGAEAAIGLAILIIYFKNKSSISVDSSSEIKG